MNTSEYIVISVKYSETLFERPPGKRQNPLERPKVYVNLNFKIFISTPDERQPLSGAKGMMASQERFHCSFRIT